MRTLCAVLAVGLLSTMSRADDVAGPKAGEKVPALKAYGVVGTVEGKEVDFAAERKDASTIYVFVAAEAGGIPTGGRPAARFLKVLDDEVAKLDGTDIVAVWLGENAFDKHKEYLPRINMSIKLQKTQLAAFEGDKGGPNNWGLSTDSHISVVVVNKGKVAKSFAFTSVNETDVKPVIEAVKKSTEK